MCNTNDAVSAAVDDDVNITTTTSNNNCKLVYSPCCNKTHSVSLRRMLKLSFFFVIFIPHGLPQIILAGTAKSFPNLCAEDVIQMVKNSL